MRNKLTIHDARALNDLHLDAVKAFVNLEIAITLGTKELDRLRDTVNEANNNWANFLDSVTETPQEKALHDERESVKKMVIDAIKIALIPIREERELFASERSHLALTLGMALGYITRPDMP